MLRYSDIPAIKAHINDRYREICKLEKMEPTPERLARVRQIESEAKSLQRTIRELKGNMYPYAV